jgi:hypothetical protein
MSNIHSTISCTQLLRPHLLEKPRRWGERKRRSSDSRWWRIPTSLYCFPSSWLFQTFDDGWKSRVESSAWSHRRGGRKTSSAVCSCFSRRSRVRQEHRSRLSVRSTGLGDLLMSSSGGVSDAQTQQIHVSASVHLAFEILEPGNLSLDLPGTPGFTQGGTSRCIFCPQAQGKAVQFLQRAASAGARAWTGHWCEKPDTDVSTWKALSLEFLPEGF